MKVFAVVVVVVVVVAILAIWTRRRRVDDVHSVEGYRHTLETLSDIRTKSSSSSVRVIGAPDGEAPPRPSLPRSPAMRWDDVGDGPGRGTMAGDPDEHTPPGGLVIGSSTRGLGAPSRLAPGPISLGAPDGSAGTRPVGPTGRGSPGEPGRGRPGGGIRAGDRRVAVALGSGLAIVVVIVAVVLFTSHSHSPRPASSTAGSHPSAVTHDTVPVTTTTTAPPTFAASSATANSGVYTPPAASYTVVVSATTGPCWVQVHSDTSGLTTFAQIVPAGQSHTVPMTGPATILLGAPQAVTITLNNASVVLPSGYRSPFTMTFQPAATSTTPSAPSTAG